MKKEVTFGSLFQKAIEDYRVNFKTVLLLVLTFVLIPQLIFTTINIFHVSSNPTLNELILNPPTTNAVTFPPTYLAITLALSVIVGLIGFLVYSSLVRISLKKSKFTFAEAKKVGTSGYLKYLGFTILVGLYLFILFLLLIVPGIIFAVYWILGIYIYFDQNKTISQSLKESRKLIKGRWWRTFGYVLLIMLITSVIAFLVSLPFSIPTMILTFGGRNLTMSSFALTSFLEAVSNTLSTLISAPIFVFFFKNYYQSLKKK